MDTFTTTTVGDKTPSSESTIELLESRIVSLNIALALSVIFIIFIVAFFIFIRIKENKKLCCCYSCWHRRSKYNKTYYWNDKRKSILSTPKDYYHLSGKDNSVMWTDDEEDDDDLESFNIATHSKSLQQRSSDNGNTTLHHKHDKGDGIPAVIPHAVIVKSMNEEEV